MGEPLCDKELAISFSTRLSSFSTNSISKLSDNQAKTFLFDTEKEQSTHKVIFSQRSGKSKSSNILKRFKTSLNVKNIDFIKYSRRIKTNSKDKLYMKNNSFKNYFAGIKNNLDHCDPESEASMNECFLVANNGAVIGRPNHRYQHNRYQKCFQRKLSGDIVNHSNSSNNNNCSTSSKKTSANKSDDAANHSA